MTYTYCTEHTEVLSIPKDIGTTEHGQPITIYYEFIARPEDCDPCHTCIECEEVRYGDLRIESGMKCGACVYA